MSAPTKRYDVCAGRPYTTRDGKEKKHWINVGRATAWDDGGISIELHATPAGNWFDGKLSLFEQKPRDQDQRGSQREAPRHESRSSEGKPPQSTDGFEDSDIPFS